MTRRVESDVVADSEHVRIVHDDASLVGIADDVLVDDRSHDRVAHMEVDRVASHLPLLSESDHRGASEKLHLRRRGMIDDEMTAVPVPVRDGMVRIVVGRRESHVPRKEGDLRPGMRVVGQGHGRRYGIAQRQRSRDRIDMRHRRGPRAVPADRVRRHEDLGSDAPARGDARTVVGDETDGGRRFREVIEGDVGEVDRGGVVVRHGHVQIDLDGGRRVVGKILGTEDVRLLAVRPRPVDRRGAGAVGRSGDGDVVRRSVVPLNAELRLDATGRRSMNAIARLEFVRGPVLICEARDGHWIDQSVVLGLAGRPGGVRQRRRRRRRQRRRRQDAPLDGERVGVAMSRVEGRVAQ
mmetsp:Transcript_22098/g.65496  ORF Transcript_22098/g.65496 Transcript_22098/m.65496 type:complete len:352 (-) Transcript_22098:1364-2419(-)